MADSENGYEHKFRGFLFTNKFAESERHPVMTGRITFTKHQIALLAKRAKLAEGDEEEIVCDAAAWKRKSQVTGDSFLFVSIDATKAPKPRKQDRDDSESDDVPF